MPTKMCKAESLCKALLLAVLCGLKAQIGHAVDPVSPGGSAHAWYKIDSSKLTGIKKGNCREPYGIIKNYQSLDPDDDVPVRAKVQQQLQVMYQNGQRRMRVPIYHNHDGLGGTNLCSNGGNLSSHDRESLTMFLEDIRNAGFDEILVSFHPTGPDVPFEWSSWNEVLFQENWNLIYRLHPIIANAGIPYRIDLGNEFSPHSSQSQVFKDYVKKLWINYNIVFGKSDTVGFSIPLGGGQGVDRYTTVKAIYESTNYGSPYLYSVHIYYNHKQLLEALDKEMTALGDSASLILGEAFYNDDATWTEIRNSDIARTVWHVYQWPRTRSKLCDGEVDVNYPAEYRY